MAHSTTYFPLAVTVHGERRRWVPELSHFVGNWPAAADLARRLRRELSGVTVRRFGGCVNVYRKPSSPTNTQEATPTTTPPPTPESNLRNTGVNNL